MKRPLHTDSLAEANRRKWPVVAELRAIISAERDKVENGEDASDHAYARSLHREIQRASSADQRSRLQEQVDSDIELRVYPRPRGMILRHLGKDVEEATEHLSDEQRNP